ncbi:ABC transporter permease [Streptomyces sp. 900105755]
MTAATSLQSLQAADRIIHQWPGDAALLITDTSAVVQDKGTGEHIEVNAYAGALREIRPFPVKRGEWPVNEDALIPGLAVNRAAAELGELTLKPTPGSHPVPVRVIAVIDDGSTTPQVWLPLQQLRSRAGADGDGTIHVIARLTPDHAPSSTGSQLNSIAQTFNLHTNGNAQRVDIVDELAASLSTMRTTFLIVGAVTLLVGVIGILNIGLATLHERAEEFALRRSLGAAQREVAVLVLVESVMIGSSGAVVASAICWALYATVIPGITDGIGPGAFPLGACLIGLAVGAGAGLLGGAIPAYRAARLPIAVVMRA